MQYFSRYAASHGMPEFGLQGDDLVFVGRISYGDEEEHNADVWYVPAEDSLKLQHYYSESECSCFTVDIARVISSRGALSQWAEAVRLLDEIREISTRVAVEPYLGNVKISFHANVHVRDDGEGGYHLIFVTHDEVPQDQLTDLVREKHPATRCQHEHDCCGHAYGGAPMPVQFAGNFAVYQQSWHLNI